MENSRSTWQPADTTRTIAMRVLSCIGWFCPPGACNAQDKAIVASQHVPQSSMPAAHSSPVASGVDLVSPTESNPPMHPADDEDLPQTSLSAISDHAAADDDQASVKHERGDPVIAAQRGDASQLSAPCWPPGLFPTTTISSVAPVASSQPALQSDEVAYVIVRPKH